MFGGLFGLVAAEATGAIRRNLTVYGLQIAAIVVALAGVGFMLDALHAWLAFSHGVIAASLMIGGGLLVVALALVLVAVRVRNRRSGGTSKTQAAMVAAPIAAQVLTSRFGLKAGIVGGVVLLALLLGRSLAGGKDES